MFNISPLEMMIIAVIALLVIGPQKLPEMARSVGRGMREFRAALSSVTDPGGDRDRPASFRGEEDDWDDEESDEEGADSPAGPP